MLYINNNGDILPSDSYVIRAGNRGHMYGDGVFESIRIFDGKPINMGNHVKRMLEGATKIKMRPPSYFDEACPNRIHKPSKAVQKCMLESQLE